MKYLPSILAACFLVAGVALSQGFSYAPSSTLTPSNGVTLSTSQTITGAKTFSATLTSSVASGSQALVLSDGARLCLNGATCTTRLESFGNQLFLTAAVGPVAITKAVEATSFTANAASGASGFLLTAGAKLCLNAACTARIQEDGSGSAVDLYFNNALQMEFTSTVAYFLTGGLRFRGTISNDTAATPVTFVDGEGVMFTRAALVTCAVAIEGTIATDILSGSSATTKRTKLCLCSSDGSGAYKWQNLATGTLGTTTTCGSE